MDNYKVLQEAVAAAGTDHNYTGSCMDMGMVAGPDSSCEDMRVAGDTGTQRGLLEGLAIQQVQEVLDMTCLKVCKRGCAMSEKRPNVCIG